MEGKVYDETETETLEITTKPPPNTTHTNQEPAVMSNQVPRAPLQPTTGQKKQYRPQKVSTRRASGCLKPFSLKNQ